MTQPLSPTDQYLDSGHYGELYEAYERPDGTAYKIVVSRYTGCKNTVEYTSRQAFYASKFDKAFDPEGKGHKGAIAA